ncbi:MAG: hypothetical protein E6J41_16030 [Chloroflexi bacterium]|nr:MAG: hypothetical protein E6J41_16030 [Chloroflexota bacterium]
MSEHQHHSMDTAYDPRAVEARWYARWEEARLFLADPSSPKPRFSIAVPPPNVTGELHMGHALNGTLQDMWSRYRRMTGYEVLWLPGTDHAAIATQNVIERQLAEEGTTKEELGRAAFESRVEEWYLTVGETIISQFRELGASLDWTRTRFTMDPAYVRAVRTAFVPALPVGHLRPGGGLARAPRHALLHPLPDRGAAGRGRGDRHRAARDDARRHRRGRAPGRRAVPAPGGPRRGPAAGGPPAADRGRRRRGARLRHRRAEGDAGPRPDGLGHRPAPSAGRDQRHAPRRADERARHARVRRPDRRGGARARGARPPGGRLPGEDRAVRAPGGPLRSGPPGAGTARRPGARPRRCRRASSRAARWRSPRPRPAAPRSGSGCSRACRGARASPPPGRRWPTGSAALTQDPDVLDTWFSSALWPFATLGWPEDTADLRAFYPTSLNSTAREIINLWVSRMIMTGIEFMGRVPFADVAIHCVVQTPDGMRMSKSRGNVLDPRVIIGRYGADALRAWAASVAMSSQDVRFDESRIEGFKRFANKLWNATRLVLNGLGEDPVAVPAPDADLRLADRWILSRLEAAIDATGRGIEDYAPQTAIGALYDFAWHDFCDWYLEAAKPRLRDGDPAARAVSLRVLDVLFRLLHPFMPFVTEELWHRLPGERGFLMRSPWPERDERFADPEAEARLTRLIALVEEIRRARQAAGAPRRGGRLRFEQPVEPEVADLAAELAAVELVPELAGPGVPLTELAARLELPAAEVDPAAQAAARERLQRELERAQAKLANQEFLARAPAAVVEKERARLAEVEDALERLGAGATSVKRLN